MPTANRRRFIPGAIAQFLAQDYPACELVVIDDGEDSVAGLVPSHPAIRYLRTPRHRSLGAKRNAACEAARADIILHWDDDDWYAPTRIRVQVEALRASNADICGIDRALFVDPSVKAAWEYVYPPGGAPWVYGAAMCYRREFWRAHPFADVNIGEDTRFAAAARPERMHVLPDNRFFVALVHPANTSRKHVRDSRWRPHDFAAIRALTGPQWPPSEQEHRAAAQVLTHAVPTHGLLARGSRAALVTAASGIGDILRVTPLIRVLHRLGHAVDVLIAPDNPHVAGLLRGAPEIRELFVTADTTNARAPAAPVSALSGRDYALATFTHWSAPLAKVIDAERSLHFEPALWLSRGDIACIEAIARALDWQGPLPEPFAMSSTGISAFWLGMVALHPGCKPGWPWKKWHGFAELARRFANVVVIGTAADRDNTGTYFGNPFDWPARVQDFTGRLSLTETAALIRQCAAIVANDSGLMHLGVALGVPTFGIFGITNPERELIPSAKMIAITKGLPCEPACRRKPWGRRDCEHHIECLKMLTHDDVADTITRTLPNLPRSKVSDPAPPAITTPAIHVAYYAAVFDASGYGAAARAYVRALHAAGIRLSVVDTGARPAQVRDSLVASLLDEGTNADFHLFHGIPPFWARFAYPLRNVIAMTVWETDTMPPLWRNPLTHAMDVWLPCRYNVEVFERALGREPFRLPHPVPSHETTREPALDFTRLGIQADDFVFYACFEWQERKNPRGILEAFHRAFPAKDDTVLVLKTNPGAAAEADKTLREIRRLAETNSRVVLCCEAWDDTKIAALHARGNCYVSLHKGEGWGYPLFEAACAGKPVIATAYSGPVDYLDPRHHWLVRHTLTPVRQPYMYYHSGMNWAEPDLTHAIEGMRWVHAHRDEAVAAARTGATALSTQYADATIGEAAKARLTRLLPMRHATPVPSPLPAARVQRRPDPPRPIPGVWYDADYFETGVKSNWENGYTWPLFKGVFEDAAAWLTEIFPDARTFLDIGCAKGFMVKALRQRGLEAWGFDHSPWALGHADPAARPFLRSGDTSTISFDRPFDVVIAMSVLESLTDEQLSTFLPRARSWATQALCAVIAMPRVTGTRSEETRDQSQITWHDRDGWIDRLRQAGWRQDPLHRAFERAVQSHKVPARMKWNVVVMSPGCANPAEGDPHAE